MRNWVMAQMLTANRLVDGLVLYWRGGGWTESIAEADRFQSDAAAAAALATAKDFVARNVVVNPYLFDVKDGHPVKEREIIRALGPSVHLSVGKQAEGHSIPFGHRPPLGSLRSPTSPQGEGERDDDVSL